MSTFTSEPGTRLGGRYRLEDRIAASGGWAAWKAIDEILARPVSVITFAPGFPRLQQVVTAARAASRLTDTRLTQVFDVEDGWEHPYIVLEWPVGDTLTDLLADGSIDAPAGVRIVAEVAAAISGAHAAGIAHLCLQPEAVRWTAAGDLKLTGLGIDAALAGISADDPELTDTMGLGSLLYAVLTGMWPGPDHPYLPSAPMSDGQPRRPRQVRAGVPGALDEITARALGLGDGESQPFTSTRELAQALAAAIPPVTLPAAARSRRDAPPAARPQPRPARSAPRAENDWDGRRTAGQDGVAGAGGSRRGRGRVAAVAVLAVVVVVGLSAAAVKFLDKPGSGRPTGTSSSSASHHVTAQTQVLVPTGAAGFDALRTPAEDPGDENSSLAVNLLNGSKAGWTTDWYGSAEFGGFKTGTGLILDMGKPIRITTVQIQFGSVPGANVQLKVGSSDTRSAANEDSMTTVATANNASGLENFTIAKPVTGRYLVVWFTQLPPEAHTHGRYQAQIFTIIIRGTD
jgi:serine/threonine protein kinase